MPLKIVVNGNGVGNTIDASWWNNYHDLLTGVMTDTPLIFNFQGSGTVLTLVAGASATSALNAFSGADTEAWFQLLPNYKVAMGPGGSAVADVLMYRSNTGELTISGNLVVTGSVSDASSTVTSPSYQKITVTATGTPGAVILPWYSVDGDCPVVYMDGGSSSQGQVWFGARQGGMTGQKDFVFHNSTSGWFQFKLTGGDFHIQDDTNCPNSDPFIVQDGAIYSHNVLWAHANGYGPGPLKFLGYTNTGGQFTLAHGLGYSIGFCHPMAWLSNATLTASYQYAVAYADANNVTINTNGSIPVSVWGG